MTLQKKISILIVIIHLHITPMNILVVILVESSYTKITAEKIVEHWIPRTITIIFIIFQVT